MLTLERIDLHDQGDDEGSSRGRRAPSALTAAARAEEDRKAATLPGGRRREQLQDKEILPAPTPRTTPRLFDLYTNKDYYGVDADHARLLVGAEGHGRARTSSRPFKWFAKEARPQRPRDLRLLRRGRARSATSATVIAISPSDSTLKGREKDAVAAAEISEALKGSKGRSSPSFST